LTKVVAFGYRKNTAWKAVTFSSTILLVALVGCRQDMQNQPKIVPQRTSAMFPDGRSARPQVEATVARSQLHEDSYFYTGMVGSGQDAKVGDRMPFLVTAAVMQRGQEQYNIYCTPCHSRVGNGAGMIVQRGYAPAANFHTDRLLQAPLGHFFNVITNGYGAMPSYAAQLTPEDRWAVAAYIRALQLSQSAKPSDVASGASVTSIQDLAQHLGFSRAFPTEWNGPGSTPALRPVAVSSTSSPSTSAPAPTKSQSSTQQPAQTKTTPAVDIAAGAKIYANNCQPCHQPNHAGMPPAIPSLVGIVKRVGPAHIRTVVSNGIPTGSIPMPAFTSLSATDINNLIAYLGSSK